MIKQSEKQFWMHRAFLLGYAFLLFAIAIRNVFHINIPIVLFLLIVTALACIGDESDIIALCIAMMALCKAFQYKYALLFCMGVYIFRFYFLRKRHDIKINVGVYAILSMMLWELLHVFDVTFTFVGYLRGFTELIFILFLFMFVKTDNLKFDYIVTFLAITTTVISFLVLVVQMQTANVTLQTVFASDYFRLGLANSEIENYGLNFNSNQLGAICIASVVALSIKIHRSKMRWYDLTLIAILLIFGIFTLSRTFLITFTLVAIYLLAIQKDNIIHKFQKVLLALIVLSIIYLSLKSLIPGIIDSFIDRFLVDDVTNGRAFLLSFYSDHIFSSFENLFFGIGFQNLVYKVQDLYGQSITVPHNAYQELAVVWGIIGLFMFSVLIIHMFLHWFNNKNKCAIDILPLIVILFSTMAGQLITSSTRLIELALAYLCIVSSSPSLKESEKKYEQDNKIHK